MIGTIGLDDISIWIRDIEGCPNIYYICLGSTFVLIWLWNLLLRAFAEVLAWISIVTVGLGLLASGFLVRNYANSNYPEGDNTQKWLNYAAYTIWGLTGVYCLAVLCCWYSIKIAVKVLRTSARIIMGNLRMILVPIVSIAITAVWIAASLYFFIWLLSTGDIITLQAPIPLVTVYYQSYNYTDE